MTRGIMLLVSKTRWRIIHEFSTSIWNKKKNTYGNGRFLKFPCNRVGAQHYSGAQTSLQCNYSSPEGNHVNIVSRPSSIYDGNYYDNAKTEISATFDRLIFTERRLYVIFLYRRAKISGTKCIVVFFLTV